MGKKINKKAIADTRKALTGKDGALYDDNGKLLATVETYTTKFNYENTDYQPLGDNQKHKVNTSYSQILVCTMLIIKDDKFIKDCFKYNKLREVPNWNFQGVVRAHDDATEERVVYNDVVPDGDIDLQNLSIGDTYKRTLNLFVNGKTVLQGKLKQ